MLKQINLLVFLQYLYDNTSYSFGFNSILSKYKYNLSLFYASNIYVLNFSASFCLMNDTSQIVRILSKFMKKCS